MTKDFIRWYETYGDIKLNSSPSLLPPWRERERERVGRILTLFVGVNAKYNICVNAKYNICVNAKYYGSACHEEFARRAR